MASTSLAKRRPRSPSRKDRKEVSITVYNQNFGLGAGSARTESWGTGTLNLEFQDVASRLQPQTVHIKSLSGNGSLKVLEQNYRYDLLTPSKLLEKYVGKKLKVYRFNEKNRQGREVQRAGAERCGRPTPC